MRQVKILLIIFLLTSKMILAQNISVLSNKKILDSDTKYYYPHLSPDGQKIALTTKNYMGLYVLDLKSDEIVQVTDKQGAGYQPAFSNDGSIVYFRSDEYEGMKKYSSVYSFDLKNKRHKLIESKNRFVSTPKIVNNKLIYTVGSEKKEKQISDNTYRFSGNVWTCIEDQKLVIYKNDKKTVLTPNGLGNYIWPRLSRDKTKILYTFAGHGTYISDLNGNILADLGYLNAPQWLNKNWVVGMKDHDNGDVFTDSDIYAVSTDGRITIQLTDTSDKIKMYPDSSSDGTKIVYHTLEGDIYLMKLNYINKLK